MLKFAWKPIWLDRVYLGDQTCIDIMLLCWLEALILYKISANIYKYIYNGIDTLLYLKMCWQFVEWEFPL